jgi:hypothetical protein
MSDLAVSYLVELQLSADEFPAGHPELAYGAVGLTADQWKPYPYGWHPPPEFTDVMAQAAIEEMGPSVLAECRRFVEQQYRTGDRPLAWRIKDASGTVIESGDSIPC